LHKNYAKASKKNTIPVRINPYHFCLNNKTIKGFIPIVACKRVVVRLQEPKKNTQVFISLKFGVYDGEDKITGKIKTTLPLLCDRCLRVFDFKIDICIDYKICDNSKDKDESYITFDKDKSIFLTDFIEDELLLSIPISPKHTDAKKCDKNILKYIV
jgi:uncharacterized protein